MEEERLKSASPTNDDSDNSKRISSFLSDLRENELPTSKFTVKIVNYKKTSSFMETFIVFKIETTGDFRPYSVERRYNDFQWLQQRLVERYPMAIVPPLPAKHNVTAIERFSGLFIDQRRNALDKFLQRLTTHHLLGLDREFWSFLTMLPATFQEYRRVHPSLGKIESLWQSMQNLSVTATITGDTATMSAANTTTECPFGKLVDDSAKAASVMCSLGRLVRRSGDVWLDLSRLCYDDSVCHGDERWKTLAVTGDQCSETAQAVMHQLDPWVTETELYWTQVENVARRRNTVEAKFLTSLAKQSRNRETSERVDQARQLTNALHDKVIKSNADLMSELEFWKAQRTADTADWLRNFADLHVEHFRKTGVVWKQLVTSLSEAPATC